jgi:hypothetical protein
MQDKNPWGFVLTRLHARYTKDNLGEDLVFKAAPPIYGRPRHIMSIEKTSSIAPHAPSVWPV